MKKKKLTTCSGLPVNFLRSTGSCVATPTGQVFRWHLRIMMQPAAISGAVAKPNSSAPSSAPITTSRPVQPAIDLHGDAAAQIVQHQRLLRFGQTDFPRRAGMLDRVSGEAPVPPSWPAIVTTIGVRLGNAGGDGADADLGHQLHADARLRVGVLQVVDELRQIFDRIDVVMRRRRDQPHARRRVAHARDPLVDLVAGQAARLRRAWRPAPS